MDLVPTVHRSLLPASQSPLLDVQRLQALQKPSFRGVLHRFHERPVEVSPLWLHASGLPVWTRRCSAAALAGLALASWSRTCRSASSRLGSRSNFCTVAVSLQATKTKKKGAHGKGAPSLADAPEAGNFVEDIVLNDMNKGTYGGRVQTRFPPEPNGYLHIGHAKSICLNFGIAGKFGGACNLRFDDTNPASEKQEYIDRIQEDVRWLGFQWNGPAHYASDYFGQLHDWAVAFIERGWAYIDELSAEEISEYRGTLTSPGKDSPYRSRPAAENLELFQNMKAGKLAEGSAVLRAKIDMAHRNVIMRDPIMYRIIRDTPHPRTGDTWCIYPSYDWAHGLSDSLEAVTHSVCTLEFNMHNELYDWFNEQVLSLGDGALPCDVLPRQHEFARLEMEYIVVSKRKLKRLVDGGTVDSWDDPRMPTISGMRRRGYPAAALRRFCELVGVTKVPSAFIKFELLEACVRDALKQETKIKLLCVLKPLRVVLTNYEGEGEVIELPQEDESIPKRRLPFSRNLFIEREDFMEEPEPGFKRLAPGRSVKLRFAYTITCEEAVHDEAGEIVELRCSYDPESLGKRPPKKVAVVHWADAAGSVPVRARLYDRLFAEPRPEECNDFMEALNTDSLEVCNDARCEPCVSELGGAVSSNSEGGDVSAGPLCAQFERCGYFALDEADSRKSLEGGGPLVFNRAVTLNESGKPGKSKAS
mmetsp:Transcript_71593/g.138299  ORF Transcript_71593/g.138299 Transcript_71593/m.138299 type:complete len:702 (+) Transcript_71593:31-2136(+)